MIKLTSVSGSSLWINPAHIVVMQRWKKQNEGEILVQSKLEMIGGISIHVTESPATIMMMISRA